MPSKRLTDKDWQTIRLALNYALDERDSYADATSGGTDDQAAHDRALALIERFEKLHQKIFNSPSQFKQQRDADAAAPKITIFELMKQMQETKP